MHLRKAFTLVELLVVIGIIAVLIALLLPSLNRARYSANRVSCLSNHRQIGMGLQMYVNEYQGYLPHAFDFTTNPTSNWRGHVRTMLKNADVYTCPNAVIDAGAHYSANPSVMREHRTGDPDQVRFAKVVRFHEVVTVFDGAIESEANPSAQQQGRIDHNASDASIPYGRTYDPTSVENTWPVLLGSNTDFWTGNNNPKYRPRWRENHPSGTPMLGLLYADGHAEARRLGDLLRHELRRGG